MYVTLKYYMDWELYAWVKRGSRRQDILQYLSKSNMPLTANDIKNNLKMSLPQSSLTLKEIRENELIDCLNPNDKIGKLYKINDRGQAIVNLF